VRLVLLDELDELDPVVEDPVVEDLVEVDPPVVEDPVVEDLVVVDPPVVLVVVDPAAPPRMQFLHLPTASLSLAGVSPFLFLQRVLLFLSLAQTVQTLLPLKKCLIGLAPFQTPPPMQLVHLETAVLSFYGVRLPF